LSIHKAVAIFETQNFNGTVAYYQFVSYPNTFSSGSDDENARGFPDKVFGLSDHTLNNNALYW
jgi:hypothetical protein